MILPQAEDPVVDASEFEVRFFTVARSPPLAFEPAIQPRQLLQVLAQGLLRLE
jgi:hypothetical protein